MSTDTQRAAVRKHYRNNKEYYLDKNNKKRQQIRDWLRVYKESHPCTDCHEFFPAHVMDFDHRDGAEKTANVSALACHGSLRRIQAEIAKCDLVCPNCHRMRTEARRRAYPEPGS